MRRDPGRLANETFDLLVIGGGIAGAAIARDAALRGLSVALVERNDFAHATSAHNSKLIHGGLRYLRNFELGLVRESLRERRVWLEIALHLVHPLPFLLPVARAQPFSRAAIGAGLVLYDYLDVGRRLPRHSWLDAREACACEPALESLRLAGAYRYFDAQMDSPERLALECVLDAAMNGAAVVNHMGATSLLLRQGRVEGAHLRDALSSARFDVRARLTIVAVGPWSDEFLAAALGRAVHRLRRSKGIHLLVPPLTRDHALTIAAGSGHFFVIPWRSGSLVGTTDTPYDASSDALDVGEAEIEGFLRLVNAHLPAARLARGAVRYAYAGLRPLIDDRRGSTYRSSRRAELIDHAPRDGIDALVSVIGGKWTTARHLAETAVDAALQKLGRNPRASTTATRILPGGETSRIPACMNEARALGVVGASLDRVVRLHGSRLPRLLDILRKRPELAAPLHASGDIGAQIVLAAREEMALTLEDVVMRRTGIGQEGDPGRAALEKAAAIMAGECGWSDAQRRAEIDSVAAGFRRAGSGA
jgi:glycerol-3-phosphate dehydrogenase